MIEVGRYVRLDENELEESFVRSSGPGGQNVNKLSTAVQLRVDVANAPGIPDWVKARLRTVAGRRLTGDGVLIIIAQRFRTQEQNRADARERLRELLAEASYRPPVRRPTRPSWGARQDRMKDKAVRSAVKRQRGTPISEE
jgi:ribosome-associated protein